MHIHMYMYVLVQLVYSKGRIPDLSLALCVHTHHHQLLHMYVLVSLYLSQINKRLVYLEL